MSELVEVSIEVALLARAKEFAVAQGLTISQPNVAFTPPTASTSAKWLRATFLPAPSFGRTINHDGFNQHYGLMQIDVFYGQGAGEIAPGRIAATIIQYFTRGTILRPDGFTVRIEDTPRRGPIIKDDPWMMIPVSIPYRCFARNPQGVL